MFKRYNLPRGILFILILFALASSGCALRLHNPYLAETAQKAQKDMDTFSENAPKMYSSMLINLEKFKEHEEYLLTSLSENYHTALVTALPAMNWKRMRARVDKDLNTMTEFQNSINTQAIKYLDARKINTSNLDSTKKTIKKYKKEIEKEREKVDAWSGYTALLQTAFTDYASVRSNLSEADNLIELAKIAWKVGNKEIEYIDSKGKKETKMVREFLKMFKSNFETLEDNEDKDLLDIEGQALSVLSLGLDLAEIEKKGALLKLARLEERRKITENFISESNIAKEFLNELKDEEFGIEDTITYKDKEYPFGNIEEYRTKAISKDIKINDKRDAINNISITILQVRKLAVAENIISRNQALLKVAFAREEHRESIVDSDIADEMWRAIMSSGIESLTAFYKGGIKPEHVANIIRIAQSIGVAAIATQVD